jgi:carboxyl-terminal processing protease
LARTSIAASILFSLACGAVRAQQPPPETPIPATIDDPSFQTLVSLVEEKYFRETPRRKLLESARDGMFAGLDPYSRYLPPAEWAWLHRGLAAEFGGIGVQIEIDDASRRPRVRRLLPGPAADAGIVPGDVILAVDGKSTEAMTLDDVLQYLPGPAGSGVRVSIRRDEGAQKPLEFVLTRRVIKTPSVRAGRRDAHGLWTEYLYDARNGIGYVRIEWFADDTVSLVEAAMKNLQARRLRGLVLDLRDDAGGSFQAAVGVADLFLDSGRIVSEIGRDGVEEATDATPAGFMGFPMVVLVNARTMSASEVLASALQDNGRAAVFGERTFGKGLVQELFPLGDGSEGIRLTVASYRRASGGNIDRFTAPKGSDEWGVCPDSGLEIFVPPAEKTDWSEWRSGGTLPTPLELATYGPDDERDPVLERALDWLRDRIRQKGWPKEKP